MRAEAVLEQVVRSLSGHGSFTTGTAKPLSITCRSSDASALLKIYLRIEPQARRDREVSALAMAGHWGVSTPPVLAFGDQGAHAWSLVRLVSGSPCSANTPEAVDRFIDRAQHVIERLQNRPDRPATGMGWQQHAADGAATHLDFLLRQLSPRCRRQPWWEALREAIAPLDHEPAVYLHGDIKPEHLLCEGGRVHVVDWEASARGPAVCDQADVMFHLVRDLIYGQHARGGLPTNLISQIPVFGPIVAWRVIRWLDRRRPCDLKKLTTGQFHELAGTRTSAEAARSLGRVIAALRDTGTPP